MMRVFAFAAAALAATTALAQAPPANGGLVTHNGSLMAVETLPGGLVQIRYVDPRPGMRAFVVPGTLLVQGQWFNGTFSGVSHSFWCGRAYPYSVKGGIDPTGALMLYGPAPIIDPYSCGVLGYEWTGNSTLRFEPFAGPRRAPTPVPSVPPIPNGDPA
ncbi:MAG: hypothetical protein WB500_10260 [Rhodoplanes sp.]